MHFVSSNYLNLDKLKGQEQDRTTKEGGIMHCHWLSASSKAAGFGTMTINIGDR